MASVQFQIHTDKENATSTGHKMMGGGLAGGKNFQALKTPRRALGSVNEAHRVGLGLHVPAPRDLKSANTTSLKPRNSVPDKDAKLKQKQQTDKENAVQKGKHHGEKTAQKPPPAKQQQMQTFCLPDIEYMPPPSPPRDDDEDMLPMKERASSYVHKLFSWRPQCIFGAQPDSEEEEEEERERQRIMEELDNLPALNEDVLPVANLHLSCEELDMEDLELPTVDDLLIPEVPLDPQPSAAHTPLPQLPESTNTSPSQLPESTNASPFQSIDSASCDVPQLEDSADLSEPQLDDLANMSLPRLEGQASFSRALSQSDESAEASSPQLDRSVNSSLRQLDDSLLGLEQHLGGLEIRDYSLTSTPKH